GVGVMLMIIGFSGKMGSALQSIYKIGLIALLYLGAMALATSFFKYTSYSNGMMDGSALYSNSLRSRWETWGILWEMIQTKPLFGHGPYKAYFSRMKLYSENEYLLMWWRYGIFGLCFYLGIYIVPFWHFVKIKITENKFKALLFLGVMLIAALTNNPLTERAISILFLFLVATAWEKSKHNEETVINRK
ncbi:MAG: O-antigen ligase family protein, partial [Flavobacteriia bacterium]|nr:O-antigen ligase family protein [Flavobacteriia bacterium]